MSSKDNDKKCVMLSKSDNIEIMINDRADDDMEELFQWLPSKYQIGLETSISDLIFDCVYLLHHKCHKINFKQGGSYIDSHDWIKNKKATKIPSIEKIIHAFNTL